MSKLQTNTIARERIDEITSSGAEPGWLKKSRLSAWEAYLKAPLPTMRDEDWRHTDVSSLDFSKLVASDAEPVKAESVARWYQPLLDIFGKPAAAAAYTTCDVLPLHLSAQLEAKGVIACDINSALRAYASLLRPYLIERSESGSFNDKFSLLNRALFNCGLFIYIPDGLTLDEPILAGASFDTPNATLIPRIIVAAGKNSKFSLINYLSSPSRINEEQCTPISLASGIVQIFVGEGASVSYLETQYFNRHVYAITRIRSEIDKDGSLNTLNIASGGAVTRCDITTELKAPGATSSTSGIVLGAQKEHFDFNTILEHTAPDTTSNINFRVALKDAASSVYQGTIKVARAAQRTGAYQSNKNLLLGAQTKADSIPRLEILADDVKCSHGATIGPVDQEQVFYLMSRGLSRTQSEETIVRGFTQQVVDGFELPAANEWLGYLMAQQGGQ